MNGCKPIQKCATVPAAGRGPPASSRAANPAAGCGPLPLATDPVACTTDGVAARIVQNPGKKGEEMDDAGRNVYWGARNAVRAARNGAPGARNGGRAPLA